MLSETCPIGQGRETYRILPNVPGSGFGGRVRGRKSGLRMAAGSLIFNSMSPTKTVCSMGDKPEQEGPCRRYCCICAGFDPVKLGADGPYYFPARMEAV